MRRGAGDAAKPGFNGSIKGAIKAEQDELAPASFRKRLMDWYRVSGRVLPWRQTTDPYRIWVSEIMLQQTRVAAVLEHYVAFVQRFPTVVALALAREEDVLAAWSGLGYYRRARMLHKAAQFLVLERAGALPGTAAELRTLPGIGDYTAAAIASIAFGESVAVIDGNVERVILRLTGHGGDAERPVGAAAMRTYVRQQAQALMPPLTVIDAAGGNTGGRIGRGGRAVWTADERIALAAAARPEMPADEGLFSGAGEGAHPGQTQDGHSGLAGAGERKVRANAAGDHNQAMMELGAVICLPRGPRCGECPVRASCRTRGEHPTGPRPKQLSREVALLVALRRRGGLAEVLLERRRPDASLMPDMYELPPVPLEQVEGREPVLRVRHAITNTNYAVAVFAAIKGELEDAGPERDLNWVRTSRLSETALTGLARKVLHRLQVMDGPRIELLR